MEPDRVIRRLARTLVSTIVGVVLIAGALVFYVNFEITQSEREWCDLLVSLDSPVPPDNPRSMEVAPKITNIRNRFGC